MTVSLVVLSRHDTARLATPPKARVAMSSGEPGKMLTAPANPTTWLIGPGGSEMSGSSAGVAPGLATLNGRTGVGKSAWRLVAGRARASEGSERRSTREVKRGESMTRDGGSVQEGEAESCKGSCRLSVSGGVRRKALSRNAHAGLARNYVLGFGRSASSRSRRETAPGPRRTPRTASGRRVWGGQIRSPAFSPSGPRLQSRPA